MNTDLNELRDTLLNHQREDTDCKCAPAFGDLEIDVKDNDSIEIKYSSKTLQLWMIFQYDPMYAPSDAQCFRRIIDRKIVSPSFNYYTPCQKFFKVSRDWKHYVDLNVLYGKISKLLIERFYSIDEIIKHLEKHL